MDVGIIHPNGQNIEINRGISFFPLYHLSVYSRNGYHLDTVLLLSVFTGMFGVDRFYLGYYGMGLLKACTLGGFFIGQLVDVILIALQIVRPADGSHYIIPYYGAGVSIIRSDNTTYRVPKDDW